jgi:hypothetical protein
MRCGGLPRILKTISVGFAILAVSTSAALAKGKGHAKPKASAAATTTTGGAGQFMTNTGSTGPFMGQVSAADRELYQKSQCKFGMKTAASAEWRRSASAVAGSARPKGGGGFDRAYETSP